MFLKCTSFSKLQWRTNLTCSSITVTWRWKRKTKQTTKNVNNKTDKERKQQNKQLWHDNKARSQLPIVREPAGMKWSRFKSLFLTLSISVTHCHTHTSTGREAVRLESEAPAAGDSSPPPPPRLLDTRICFCVTQRSLWVNGSDLSKSFRTFISTTPKAHAELWL